MDQYVTVQNMKLCETVFGKYMNDKFKVHILPDDSKVKRIIFKIMQDMKMKPPADIARMGIKQLNDMTLNIARDVYMATQMPQNQTPPPPPPPHVLSSNAPPAAGHSALSREQALYGARPLSVNTLMPHITMKESDRVNVTFEKLMSDRRSEFNDGAQALAQRSIESEKVDKVESAQMERLLSELEKARTIDDTSHPIEPRVANIDFTDPSLSSAGPQQRSTDSSVIIRGPDDAAAVYRSFQGTYAQQSDKTARSTFMIDTVKEEDSNLATLQTEPSDVHRRVVNKYISVNSFDRNWFQDPFRYSYTVSFAGYGENEAQNRYRNVTALSVTRVIIPLEITERMSLNSNINSRNEYINDYSFNFPYIMVCIDGIDDMYDGTNDHVRRAFSMMMFSTAYRTKSGRGFVILEPMQEEKKLFYPVSLSNLRSLKISLVKPNGAILNNSTDDYMLTKVEHEDYNASHLCIVLDKHFDKNDYYIGDTVLIRGYKSYKLEENASVDAGSYQRFNDFINRPEGHEIVEIGQANDNGYYRTFYILSPGILDKVSGRLVLDYTLINTLNAFNAQQQDADANYSVANGGVCNASLQNTISFTLWHEIFDAKTDTRK